MHIRIVLPIVQGKQDYVPAMEQVARPVLFPGTTIDCVYLAEGPPQIENAHEEALALRGILRCVEAAIEDGVDGVFISCFADPAVPSARELSGMPVVGGFEPAVLAAASLSDHFAIVTVMPSVRPMLRRLLLGTHLESRCVAVRTIDVPVQELTDMERLSKALLAQSLAAVREDGAEAIILGCTGMMGVADRLQRELEEQLGAHVPVVDPNAASLTLLQSVVLMKRRHSAITYMPARAEKHTAKRR